MAIIYTYPRLTNPDGTELIVVSETKNQNATRLLSVGDICEFCSDPSGGGCSNSFLTVTTPASIIPATALGCDDNLVLTSGDGSITISNVGNTINFTTAGGGGGGGCPTTYVIKPVFCEGPDCYTDPTRYIEWIYTCDETIGALAPGYIEDLQINGDTMTPPSETTCWYIEEVSISATSTVCCCDEETAYKLSPCDIALAKYYTTEALTPGISALVGLVILATTPEGTLCYTVTEESGDPPIAVTPLAPVSSCEDELCTIPPGENLLLTPCDGNSSEYLFDIITDTIQSPSLAGVLSGDTISIITLVPEDIACYEVSFTPDPIGLLSVDLETNFGTLDDACDCCAWEFRTYAECFTGTEWIFSVNDHAILATNPDCIKVVPPGMEMPPVCLNFVECTEYVEHPDPVLSLIDNSPNCCDDEDCPSTARYEKCPDAPGGYEEFIYLSIPTGAANVILATGDLDPGVIGDETWCYTYKDNVEGPVFAGTVADYCAPLAHCMCPESCEIMEYFNCDDPGTLLYTTNMSLPPAGFIWGIAEDSNCYKTSGPVLPNGLPLNVITVDAVWMDSSEECGCCAGDTYPFTYIYNLCSEYDPAPGGAPLSVIVDITGFPNYLAGAYPNVVSVDVGIGYDVCYEFGDGICTLATHTITDYYIDCETCIAGGDPVWKLLPCGGTPGIDDQYVSQSELSPDPSGLNVGEIINTTAGTLSAIASCWEIIDKNSPDPVTQIGNQDWNGPITASADEYYDACECCEIDLRLYDVCDLGDPCMLTVAPQLIIDMSVFGGTPPSHIVATDVATGNDCCYYLNEVIPDCQEFTGTYVSTIADCEDETCGALGTPVWDLLPCGGTPGVDNVYLSEGYFAPDPSGLNVGDIIDITGGTISDGCYEVIDKNSATPASHTGTHNWTGPVLSGGTLTACECCEIDLRKYWLCDLGDPCTAGQAAYLIIDMTGVSPIPSDIIATEIATGNDCCYYLDATPPECEDPTGTYSDPNEISSCEDPACPGL